jgi:hypothetical protein
MRRSFLHGLAVLGLLAPAALPGCAPAAEDADSSQGAASEGLKERFADLRKVNTDDLSRIVANGGAQAVNSALKVKSSYVTAGITVAPMQVFAARPFTFASAGSTLFVSACAANTCMGATVMPAVT